MGNNIGCCRRGLDGIEDFDLKFSIFPTDLKNRSVSTTNLLDEICIQPKSNFQSTIDLTFIQHISDREPENDDIDPSLNLNISPGFLTLDLKSQKSRKTHNKIVEDRIFSRSNSCGTVFIKNNTITRPDLVITLKCVSYAVAIFLHRSKNLDSSTNILYNDVYFPFDERKNPINFSKKYHKYDLKEFNLSKLNSFGSSSTISQYRQNQTFIYAFLRDIFYNSQLGPECAICALILFERLITSCELAVLNWTWRRQLLICIVISSKILDDQAIWNADYCQILKDVSVDDLNSLERHVLQLLQFNINVDRSIYIKYFFELMSLSKYLGLETKDKSDHRLLDAKLATQISLIKPCADRKINSNYGYIFDLSFPYLFSKNNRLESKKNRCDFEMLSNNKGNIKVDQNYFRVKCLESKNKKMLDDLKKISKSMQKAEQVASITSTSYYDNTDSGQSLKKTEIFHANSNDTGEENRITSTKDSSEVYEFEDDYNFLLKAQNIQESEHDWSKVGLEFF